jgi:hypothetical protein
MEVAALALAFASADAQAEWSNLIGLGYPGLCLGRDSIPSRSSLVTLSATAVFVTPRRRTSTPKVGTSPLPMAFLISLRQRAAAGVGFLFCPIQSLSASADRTHRENRVKLPQP